MKIMERLLEVAGTQRGYVTTQDARDQDVNPVELRKLAQRGQLINVAHGVYRIAAFPAAAGDEYMEAALWPAGRGVISHEAALDVWDLADVNPAKIDITVPAAYYPRRRHGGLYRVWHQDLPPKTVDYVDGIPVVGPAEAIRGAAKAGVDRRLLAQAIDNAVRRRLVGQEEARTLRAEVGAQ